MVKVLHIRPTPRTQCAGVDVHCRALGDLFAGDSQISVLPVEDYAIIRSGLFNDFYKWKPLLRRLRESGADVVHIHGYTSFSTLAAFLAAKKCGKKIVYTAHWHPFSTLRRPMLGRMFFNLLLRPLVKHYASVVVTLNDEDTAQFRKFHKNVHRIPHWMRFDTEPELLHTAKRKDRVLFVGRINDPNKGVEYLYELPEGKYDIQCVGKGALTLRSDMTQHENLSLDALKRLYAESAVLVVPSKYEAFSYVTLEALALGTPVVVSDRVRIADYLHGYSGCTVFPFRDAEAFRDAVERTIGMPVDREAILRQFDPERIRELYRALYTDTALQTKKRG